MSILETTKEIINDINSLKNIEKTINKENTNDSLHKLEKSHHKKRRKKFRITYLRTVIQFLDLNSFISLSLVNKEFYYFLSSIYAYKFINQIQNHQKLMKNKKINPDIKTVKTNNSNKTSSSSNKKGGYSFFSALTGALSYFTPSTEINTIKVEKKPDLNEINSKIDLHLNILNEKAKQLELSKEISEIRKNIDELINERFNLKEQNEDTRNTVMQEKEYEKIKREKYEKDYKDTLNELNMLKNSFSKLKQEYEKNKKEYIENELNLTKIGEYINKNMI